MIHDLNFYRDKVTKNRCRWDNARLPLKVNHYEHEGGWKVDGFAKKQWLSLKCPKCGYAWSLWKLGVPREE